MGRWGRCAGHGLKPCGSPRGTSGSRTTSAATSRLGGAGEADVDVVLVARVGEEGARAVRGGGADLAGLHAGPALTDPQRELAGGLVGGADRVAVDLVDVDRAPHAVVGNPGGALDVPGIAGPQARHPDAVVAGGGD